MTALEYIECFIIVIGTLIIQEIRRYVFLTDFVTCYSQLWGRKIQVVFFGLKESVCKMDITVIFRNNFKFDKSEMSYTKSHLACANWVSSNHYGLQQKVNFIFILVALALFFYDWF